MNILFRISYPALLPVMVALHGATPDGFRYPGTDFGPENGVPAMPAGWQETPAPEKLGLLPSKTQQEEGFLVYSRYYMTETTPYSVPQSHESADELRVFATRSEYEPASFSVYALKPLKEVRVEPGDLRTDAGAVISRENLDLRLAAPLPFPVGSEYRRYKWKDYILVKRDRTAVDKERSARFWLTIHVPAGAEPGFYRGTVRITADGREKKLKLLLRVLPVELQADPGVDRGTYIGSHEKNMEIRRRCYLDMREHGINAISWVNFSVWPTWRNGRVELNFDRIDQEMQLYRDAGFRGAVTLDMRPIQTWLIRLQEEMEKFKQADKPFPDQYDVTIGSYDISPKNTEFEADAYRRIVREIATHARENHYPQLYYLPQEESTNKGVRIQQLRRFSHLLKECGVPTTSWSNGMWSGLDELQEIDPDMDFRYYSFITPEMRERTRKSGDLFGLFNGGNARLLYGFFGWKTGAKGIQQWAYGFSDAKNILARGDDYYDGSFTLPGKDGPLPSVQWEQIREGNDDAKVLYTLDTLIRQAMRSDHAKQRKAAETARAELESVLAQVPDSTAGLLEKLKNFDPAQLDIWRFKLIRQIMILQEERTSEGAPDKTAAPAKKNAFILNVTPASRPEQRRGGNTPPVPCLVVPRTAHADFDAGLNGASWENAAVASPFLLTGQQAWTRARAVSNIDIGAVGATRPSQPTTAKVFYDRFALYIRFDCREEKMSGIVANATVRDGAVWSDDAVEFFVSPRDDSGYFQVAANSKGVFADSRWLLAAGQKQLLPGWDPEIKVVALTGKSGWSAALRIPFSAFGLDAPPREGSFWRANFCREEQPVPGAEYSSWAPVESSFHETDRWGILFFGKIPPAVISGIEPSEPGIGENRLTVTVENHSGPSFDGNLVLRDRNTGKDAAAIPVRVPGKRIRLEIPYLLEKPGSFDFDLLLMKEGCPEPVHTTRYQCGIPRLLSYQLLQRELAGTPLRARLKVSVSPISLPGYHLRCELRRDSMPVAGEAVSRFPANSDLTFDTARLPPGKYELTVELVNPANAVIARKTDSFQILERIF